LKVGLGIEQFWSLTPRELAMFFDADLWRQKQERERDLAMAWQVAMLARAKRLPSLASLLRGKPEQPTDNELARRRAEHEELVKRMVRDGGRD
jgi:hypothetical protein